ncbi:peptidase M28 [Aurantibacter aestuarii]|uniref:Peptidase M28 n=2 Tax=Aurantibacter aestuarii TaxID=1266046 RepID=A0A2T1NBK8_9FLAO|nr:peptidase M28 [Aurantibacter aestuarii]
MIYKYSMVVMLLLFSCNTSKEVKQNTNSEIKADYLKKVVNYLASDELKGRDTGSEGIKKAADFIIEEFKAIGVSPYFDGLGVNSYLNPFEVKNKNGNTLNGYNVVGYLEGTDKTLKNEFIILGAHYDHIGEIAAVNGDVIANGANDNAVGSSAVLAMAKYFAETKSNKRSILFVLFSAEEKGLLGSKHLSAQLKNKNLNLYAMINFEMIGVPMKNRSYKAYISGYELSNMADHINSVTKVETIGLLPKAKAFNLFKRSDNYPFYEDFKVPAQTISTFDFENYDYYHHVDDEPELMDYNFMASLLNELKPAIVHFSNTPTKELKMYE